MAQGIDAGRRQYADILADLGFILPGYCRGRGGGGAGGAPVHDVDQYSSNARVVKSALTAGFYPQVRQAGAEL